MNKWLSVLITLTFVQQCSFMVPNLQKPNIASLTFLLPYIQQMKDTVAFWSDNATTPSEHQCVNDLLHVIEKYKEKEYWPYYMLDASQISGHGIYHGHSMFIGSWEECLTFKLREDYRQPQYCLLSIDPIQPIDLQQYGYFMKKFPYYHAGVCIPASCEIKFLNEVIETMKVSSSDERIGDYVKMWINEGDCHKRNETKPFTPLNWIVLGMGIGLATIVLSSTLYDVWQRFFCNNDRPNKLLIAFSIYTNGQVALNVEEDKGKLRSIIGLKGMAALYTIYIHTFVLFVEGNVSDLLYARVLAYNNSHSAAFTNAAFNNADTFLFLSGATLVLAFYRDVRRTAYYNPIVAVIKRYVRLMLPLGVLMLIRIGLSEQLGEGPVYNMFNSRHQRNCNSTYAQTLLAYNNYAGLPYDMSWYIPLDLQLFAISQIVLIIALKKSAKLAGSFAVMLSTIFAAIEFSITYIRDVGPTPFIDRYQSNFKYDFAYAHTRAAPWFIGMAFGFIMHKFEENPPQMSWKWRMAGWTLAKVLMAAVAHAILLFDFINYTQPASAIYISLHRILWPLPLAWIVFASTFGFGGPIAGFLEWGPVQFLGNISFELFLWHVPVIDYVIAVARETLHLSLIKILSHVYSVTFYSIGLSVLTVIALTRPSRIIMKHLSKKIKIGSLEPGRQLKVNAETAEETQSNRKKTEEAINQLESILKSETNADVKSELDMNEQSQTDDDGIENDKIPDSDKETGEKVTNELDIILATGPNQDRKVELEEECKNESLAESESESETEPKMENKLNQPIDNVEPRIKETEDTPILPKKDLSKNEKEEKEIKESNLKIENVDAKQKNCCIVKNGKDDGERGMENGYKKENESLLFLKLETTNRKDYAEQMDNLKTVGKNAGKDDSNTCENREELVNECKCENKYERKGDSNIHSTATEQVVEVSYENEKIYERM